MHHASTSNPVQSNVRRPRVRRWLRLIAIATIAATCIMVAIAAWATFSSWGAQEKLKETEAWARQATLQLRSLPGGEKLKVSVPVRMYFNGPNFGLLVHGGVLDDETDARLHAAFNAYGPPRNVGVRWNPWNFYGDARMYQKMEAELLDEQVSSARPSAANP